MVAFAFATLGCAQHYSTNGLVLRVDKPAEVLTISHQAFPGYMDAMVMPFDLRGSARDVTLTPGDRIRL
ncbi:MAG: copper-binding protein, partial [Acidobacteria bacterium]|nr:copper-binding protein [Acidobacteriota bacterium]